MMAVWEVPGEAFYAFQTIAGFMTQASASTGYQKVD
jgi:hypothetical protein